MYPILALLADTPTGLCVEETVGEAKGLISSLQRTSVTYDIPDELASDGAPNSPPARRFLPLGYYTHSLSK